MADTDRDEQYRFMQETFKDEVPKGRRIWNFIWRTVGHGLVFGIAACIAFYVIQPWASKHFGQKEPSVATFQEQEGGTPEGNTAVKDYEELKKVIHQVADQARTCVVEISSLSDGIESDSEDAETGLIIWKDRNEILILTSANVLDEEESYKVRFVDDLTYPIELKKEDRSLEMAVFSLRTNIIEESTLDAISCVKWGDSKQLDKGSLVLCMGYQDGAGEGTINSVENHLSRADKNYDILTTDISDIQPGGTGVLFNMEAEAVGIIDENSNGATKANLVSAYAISDFEHEIACLLNGKNIPYLGVYGIDVTKEIHKQQQIPIGIYVKKVESNSPAMEAGIQSGDVIVKMNQQDITTLEQYSQILQETSMDEHVTFVVKRQGADGYVDVAIDAIVGMKK